MLAVDELILAIENGSITVSKGRKDYDSYMFQLIDSNSRMQPRTVNLYIEGLWFPRVCNMLSYPEVRLECSYSNARKLVKACYKRVALEASKAKRAAVLLQYTNTQSVNDKLNEINREVYEEC